MSAEFGVEHAFGRVEAKLDAIANQVGGHGETLAKHDVRIGQTEADIRGIKAGLVGEQGHQRNGRQMLMASLASAGAGSFLTWLITALTTHH
ncbi:hypothetical protein [Kutzneria buriramensis]|uniref:Uncharacterized protein n=1 Tax=Kutzneria buriramensis TaxID=1045776 RepID=A0A3E0HEF6_9PSEU|nr:hypothetical protein [Kutzneria buriramensis]REH43654.1 hypothetical protein BCF44_109197 [Kutzneria buriramensis]